jgi:DNA topoisomerase-2
MQEAEKSSFKKFKLEAPISLNMVLWRPITKEKEDEKKMQMGLHVYKNAEEILNDFYSFRLPFYGRRKDSMLAKLSRQLELLTNKTRFILMVVNDELKIRNVPKLEILSELWSQKFQLIFKSSKEDEESDHQQNIISDKRPSDKQLEMGYAYLMSLPLWSLSVEEVARLKTQHQEIKTEWDTLNETTATKMWLRDLDELQEALDRDDKERAEQLNCVVTKQKQPQKRSVSSFFPTQSLKKIKKELPQKK